MHFSTLFVFALASATVSVLSAPCSEMSHPKPSGVKDGEPHSDPSPPAVSKPVVADVSMVAPPTASVTPSLYDPNHSTPTGAGTEKLAPDLQRDPTSAKAPPSKGSCPGDKVSAGSVKKTTRNCPTDGSPCHFQFEFTTNSYGSASCNDVNGTPTDPKTFADVKCGDFLINGGYNSGATFTTFTLRSKHVADPCVLFFSYNDIELAAGGVEKPMNYGG